MGHHLDVCGVLHVEPDPHPPLRVSGGLPSRRREWPREGRGPLLPGWVRGGAFARGGRGRGVEHPGSLVGDGVRHAVNRDVLEHPREGVVPAGRVPWRGIQSERSRGRAGRRPRARTAPSSLLEPGSCSKRIHNSFHHKRLPKRAFKTYKLLALQAACRRARERSDLDPPLPLQAVLAHSEAFLNPNPEAFLNPKPSPPSRALLTGTSALPPPPIRGPSIRRSTT